MIHELQRESMDIDNPRKNEGSLVKAFLMLLKIGLIQGINGFGRSGEESPCLVFIWTDAYIFPGVFARLVREDVLQVDVDAFFSYFSWKIPSKAFRRDNKEIFRNHSETSEHPVCDSRMDGCNAGNKFCSSLDTGEDSVLEIMFCDICCSDSFYRDCCWILCSRTINKALGSHSYIRCEATIDGYICGHNCHIDCALRAYMAGTVGGSIGLEAEYYCCRCESRTDLVSHVTKLLQICELIDSHDDIEKILNVGI